MDSGKPGMGWPAKDQAAKQCRCAVSRIGAGKYRPASRCLASCRIATRKSPRPSAANQLTGQTGADRVIAPGRPARIRWGKG